MTSYRPPKRRDWSALHIAGAPRRGNFNVLESGVEAAGGPVLMALDGEGFYHVLVPSGGAPFEPDRRSAGVHLLRRTLEEPDFEASEFADVACRKAHLSSIFLHLAEDLLGRLEQSPQDPVAVCRAVLLRWRELLDREAPSIMSRQALAGLFGELLTLRTIMSHNSAGFDAWTGPTSSIHDFTRGSVALEVKTTLRRDGWQFEIHGHRQLEAPAVEGGELYLAVLRIESSRIGKNVPDIVEELCALGADRMDLYTRLAAVGYDPRDAEVYREMPFKATAQRMYRIDESFPRVVSSTFAAGRPPPGVLHLRYTIDLTSPPAGAIDGSEWEAVVSRLADPS